MCFVTTCNVYAVTSTCFSVHTDLIYLIIIVFLGRHRVQLVHLTGILRFGEYLFYAEVF